MIEVAWLAFQVHHHLQSLVNSIVPSPKNGQQAIAALQPCPMSSPVTSRIDVSANDFSLHTLNAAISPGAWKVPVTESMAMQYPLWYETPTHWALVNVSQKPMQFSSVPIDRRICQHEQLLKQPILLITSIQHAGSLTAKVPLLEPLITKIFISLLLLPTIRDHLARRPCVAEHAVDDTFRVFAPLAVQGRTHADNAEGIRGRGGERRTMPCGGRGRDMVRVSVQVCIGESDLSDRGLGGRRVGPCGGLAWNAGCEGGLLVW